MKKILLILVAVVFGLAPMTKADEGMWLPIFIERLNYADMQKEGLHLTPEEIYSINHSSIKDAIAIFGGGCTSEIISNQGLLLTNHHCGYGSIQAHSSLEHDYLSNGFWAETMADELPNPGLKATFLVRIEDVSEMVLATLSDTMSEDSRWQAVKKISKEITDEATDSTHYTASIRSFYEGNEYYLFVYEVYRDIRFVGAPPSSIGKFGADTDNWMWPRHTADFSMFRVYTDKDGNPAGYSENNVPMKPKHSLPISVAGVKEGDFAMILGYPGGTDRYMTSYGVKLALDVSNNTVVTIRDKKLKIMLEDMQADPAVRIKYASKYAGTSNYWKYYIGQTKGLKRLHVYDKKVELENRFTNWVDADNARKEKYGDVLKMISDSYSTIDKYEFSRIYLREAIQRGSELPGYANSFSRLAAEISKKDMDTEKVDKMVESLKKREDRHFKNYNEPTDRKLLAAMLEMYYKNVPVEQQPQFLKDIASKYKNDFGKYADYVFDKSNFTTPENVNALLEKPSAKKINKDPALLLYNAFTNFYNENYSKLLSKAYDKREKGNRLFMAGLLEMEPNKKFYPDANFTMRMTYGQVFPYYPADAIFYEYYTTLKGVMEKEDPDNWEFVVPSKLKELYEAKDYGIYGEDGKMHTCFISNLDITGGNSGSPVMNGYGELIGIAFDGNWEAMSGDIAFEPELQRTISVDIRYVLFIIDKFAGATRLIDEMNIVKARHATIKPENAQKKEEMQLEPVKE